MSLEYLNQFLTEEHRVQLDQRQRSKGLTLAQAKEKYPTWYTRRIEQGEPRGAIPYSRRLYDWWKRQIISGATVGHRYWCMTMLAVYARKCSVFDEKKNPNPVTREELERDAWDLMAHMESLTNDEANHFTTDDIMKALESFDEKWLTYPRAAVQYRSGIIIPPNKRNHLSRVDHIQLMNFMRKLRHTPGGAPTKQNAVEAWQQQHPEGRKADCHRDTGLSRTTIDKWWKD